MFYRLSKTSFRDRILTVYVVTSLQARFAGFPASPAGLFSRFSPLDFAFCAGILLALLPWASRSRFTIRAHKNFWKRSVSQSTRNALKRIEMQKKFDPLRASRYAQSPSGEAQLYLPQVTPRVPRSVNAKLHADRTKTVVRRGILIYWIQTNLTRWWMDGWMDWLLTYSIDARKTWLPLGKVTLHPQLRLHLLGLYCDLQSRSHFIFSEKIYYWKLFHLLMIFFTVSI